MPGLRLGKCRIADANQHMAEAEPVIIAAVSISDFTTRSPIIPEMMAIILGYFIAMNCARARYLD